jgi:adenosylcobinamide kinase/adenosylcobinamide-phosphate guanylyltransferase
MKVLYVGGQKSGKSVLAEKKILEIAKEKPFYIATYDNRYGDDEMYQRLRKHQQRRHDRFITIEESLRLDLVIEDGKSYLVDCLSMWIMNILEAGIDYVSILETVLQKKADIVFVLNSVGEGIIPDNALARKYVDFSGVIGQITAASCDEVYEVVVGLEKRLK